MAHTIDLVAYGSAYIIEGYDHERREVDFSKKNIIIRYRVLGKEENSKTFVPIQSKSSASAHLLQRH
jgi:hypothetical protein